MTVMDIPVKMTIKDSYMKFPEGRGRVGLQAQRGAAKE